MAIAFSVGYVLGTQAGRDRYEEIVAFAKTLLGESAATLPARDEHGRFVARQAQT
jgi:hypothetical protein